MTNQGLLQKAIEAGFSFEDSGFTIAADGKDAVLLPRDIESLKRLEQEISTLKSVEDRFHNFVLRA